MLKIRASCLSKIMSDPKSIDEALLTDEIRVIVALKKRTDEQKLALDMLKTLSLSEGAKTYLKQLAKEEIYGYKPEFVSKYTDKGLIVEDEAINLLSRVVGVEYQKNFERKENEFISGECDIDAGDKIIDTKASWSLNTFPCFSEDGENADYEWQGRAYMWLWDRPKFEIAYCLVSTPEGLLREDEAELHDVEHIDESLRVTLVKYERDMALEEKIKHKVEASRIYYKSILDKLINQHNFKEVNNHSTFDNIINYLIK